MFLDCNMRLNTLTICLLCAIAVLVGAVLYLYSKDKTKENLEAVRPPPVPRQAPAVPTPDASSAGGAPAIVLFHATWCPHCKDVLPIWQQLKAGAKGNIQILDIESKDPAMTQHQIPGFPTIRFFPQGPGVPQNHQDYTGPRTIDGIVQFLSSL